MYHNQYFKLILVIILILDNVYSWNYYRSYRQVDDLKACAFIKCKDDERCVNRKFSCKFPPCPNMMYCAKTERESLRGPSTCDTVQCSKGHICIVKVRHFCGEQLARCISEIEYHNGPASCAGYKCPAGHACILRESLCIRPPCKLLRSCASKRDYNIWLDKCKTLGCLSSHECFLRRPGNVCESPPCKHTPDCTAKTEIELSNIPQKCHGWICPRNQSCEAIVDEPCKNYDCKIFRTCIEELDDRDDLDNTKNYSKNSEQPALHLRNELQQFNAHHDGRKNKVKSTAVLTSTEKSLLTDVNPTLSTLSLWMNYLRNETGIEAVKNWVQKAEDANDYAGFRHWLDLVKELLGAKAYSRWLEEIRDITATSKAFQQWLPSPNITKLLNSNQSSASPKHHNDTTDDPSRWISIGDKPIDGIYNTQSLMNHLYQQHHPVNLPRIFPYVLAPGAHPNSNLERHYGYVILPPINYPSESIENSPQPTIESAQRDVFRQSFDNTEDVNENRRASLINLLQKLKEERLLYLEVINKTQELMASTKPLLPPSHLDELVEKLQNNKTQVNDFDWNSMSSPRLLTEESKNISNQQNSSNVVEVNGKNDSVGDDYSAVDDSEFYLVDYNAPSALNINQTLPRILIKVENDLNSAMRLGDIGVKYDDQKSSTNSSYHPHSKNDDNNNQTVDDENYYTDDFHYNLRVPTKHNNTDTSKT
ncbi:hypothetical protein PV328_010114 [Microctonus aethiopoides]|uniref:Uncharacterized protein n=1 Tax=Microctonus aethiopoides TaxID=144406 RepID=A0AA39C778_9HYME|nr:hypothetical protein PV328_010114 [Microctonus aethiopoides]